MGTSDMATNDIKLDTVEGNPLLVNVYTKNYHHGAASTITVNGKKVIKADVKATNGVVHFIDGVMMIPKGDLVAVLAGDERFSTLVTAVTEAGLVDTVKNADAFTIFAPQPWWWRPTSPPPTGWCTPSTPSSKLGTQSSGDIMYKILSGFIYLQGNKSYQCPK